MDRETIEKRLQEIEKHIQQAAANFNMLEGGKQECLYWLDQLNKVEARE